MVTSSINQVKVSYCLFPWNIPPQGISVTFLSLFAGMAGYSVKELGWYVFCLILTVREQCMSLTLVLRTFETNNK
jgi:hypothetical protein